MARNGNYIKKTCNHMTNLGNNQYEQQSDSIGLVRFQTFASKFREHLIIDINYYNEYK